MVEVHNDRFLLYLGNGAVETLAIGIHQGHYGTLIDVLCVQFALDEESLQGNFLYALGDVGAISLVLAECNLESLACLQGVKVVLQSLQHHAHAADELEGHVGACFLNQLYLLFCTHGGIQLVLNCDITVFHIVCCFCVHFCANVRK